MAQADWFYARGGRQEGPTDLQTLRDMIANGQLTPANLVWRDGMAAWQPAGEVEALSGGAGAFGVAAAAPPYEEAAPGLTPHAGYAPPGSYAQPAAGQAPVPYYQSQPVGYRGHYRQGQSYADEARTAMIVSIIGIFCFGIILGPIGLVLGLSAKRNMRASGNMEGEGMATAAIVIGSIIVGLAALAILLFIVALAAGAAGA